MKFNPIAVLRTRTWPGPGSPTWTSSHRRLSGPPCSWMRTACGMECSFLVYGRSGKLDHSSNAVASLVMIWTGHAEVGHARTPPEFMEAVDVLETDITGLGLPRSWIGG